MTWFRIGYTETFNVAVEADSKEEALERFNNEGMADEFDRDVAYIDCEAEVWQELDGSEAPSTSFPKPIGGPVFVNARAAIDTEHLGTEDPEFVRGVVEVVYRSVDPKGRPWSKLEAARSIHPEVAILMQDVYGWSK